MGLENGHGSYGRKREKQATKGFSPEKSHVVH